MRFFFFVSCTLFLHSLSALGALPPYAERNRSFSAITGSGPLMQLITSTERSSGRIDGVRLVYSDNQKLESYAVDSGSCTCKLNVVRTPIVSPDGSLLVGPPKITLQVPTSMNCR